MERPHFPSEFAMAGEIPEFSLPHTLPELTSMCLARHQIKPHLSLCPGLSMKVLEHQPSIKGMYGLTQLDVKTGNPVARCGFSVEESVLHITHTPQGNPPAALTQGERQRLRSREFRLDMLRSMINIGRELRLKEVLSLYSGDHYGLALGLMSDDEAYYRMDLPLETLGFELFEQVSAGSSTLFWRYRL